jgi:hypothetical protein
MPVSICLCLSLALSFSTVARFRFLARSRSRSLFCVLSVECAYVGALAWRVAAGAHVT